MVEDQVPEPRGVRCRRLERPGGQPAADRSAAARLLHAGWRADLRRPRRHRPARDRVRTPVATSAAARNRQDAAIGTATAWWPVQLAAGALSGALGAPRDGCRGELRRVDAGRFATTRRLSG